MQKLITIKQRWQSWFWQVLILLALLSTLGIFARNLVLNLRERGIASGFHFLGQVAGFDLAFHLLSYDHTASFGRMFLLALLNTLLVSFLGIIFASLIGLLVALARLSKNPLLRFLASSYVEVLRNIPLLLQLFFWYFAVLRQLPGPRQSFSLGGYVFLNNRSLAIPFPEDASAAPLLLLGFLVGLILGHYLNRYARRLRIERGSYPIFTLGSFLLPLAVPALFALLFSRHWTLSFPELQGFNFSGGLQLIPEFVSLVLALSLYTAAFISEIIRAGVLSVGSGQLEAAQALGLSRRDSLRLIVLPQAMRVIIPPLSSQYLNLTKNSSLAAAIAFPDLVLVFAGTALNITGQAVELMGLTMLVYLSLSLSISFMMNRYQAQTSRYLGQGGH